MKRVPVLVLKLMVTLCLKTLLIVKYDVNSVEIINVVFSRGSFYW